MLIFCGPQTAEWYNMDSLKSSIDFLNVHVLTVDWSNQEEMQRYQFSSPSVPDREEFPHNNDTASTSLIDNGNGKGSHQNNGFFNGGLTTALNGDRARWQQNKSNCKNKTMTEKNTVPELQKQHFHDSGLIYKY